MIPASFEYYRAASVSEALRLLGEHQGAKLLAGGHSLIPMLKLRLAEPSALIDIRHITALRGVTLDDGLVRIGSLTPHAEIARSPTLQQHCPLLAEAAGKIGDPQVRNRGTIGGNIAHADPASDLPAVLLAVGATVHLEGPRGSRSVAAADFFLDMMSTAMEATEVLTVISAPVIGASTGTAYLKVEHPASGYAVCGAAAVVSIGGDGLCRRASLAFNGIAATPFAADRVASALAGTPLDAAALAAAMAYLSVDDPLSDLHASGEYRVALARAYGRRAIALAAERARG